MGCVVLYGLHRCPSRITIFGVLRVVVGEMASSRGRLSREDARGEALASQGCGGFDSMPSFVQDGTIL